MDEGKGDLVSLEGLKPSLEPFYQQGHELLEAEIPNRVECAESDGSLIVG